MGQEFKKVLQQLKTSHGNLIKHKATALEDISLLCCGFVMFYKFRERCKYNHHQSSIKERTTLKMNKYHQILNQIIKKGKRQDNKKGAITFLLNEALRLKPIDLLELFEGHAVAIICFVVCIFKFMYFALKMYI